MARCGTTRLRHHSAIGYLAVSPDGKLIATAGETDGYSTTDHPIRLWDAATGKELQQLRGHAGEPLHLAFSPDGRTLASMAVELAGSDPGDKIRIWDVATGKQVRLLDSHRPSLLFPAKWFRTPVAFSPDGRMLASSGRDDAVRLWDVVSWKELRCWHNGRLAAILAFSPDGSILACEEAAGIRLLDVTSGTEGRIALPDLPGSICALEFSPDGRTIVSCHSEPPLAADGKTIVPGNQNAVLRWWDRATGKELHRLKGALAATSADGKWLAIRQDRDILLWDMAAGKPARRFPLRDVAPPDPRLNQVQVNFGGDGGFSADGSTLVLPDRGKVCVLDTRTGQERHGFPGHSDKVVLVGFSPDGRRLISVGDRCVRFWDPPLGKELGSLRGPVVSIGEAALSTDGKTLAAETCGAITHIWDLETDKEVRQLALGPPSCPPLALTPDGKTLAIRDGAKGDIRFFDLLAGKDLRRFDRRSCCDGLAFLPDGLTWAELNSSIDLFDGQTGSHFCRMAQKIGRTGRTAMAFSPDGRLVATGHTDRDHPEDTRVCVISLWETASGKFIAQFRGHEGPVATFAFAHGGGVVASGGRDGTVRLWDLASGRELRIFKGHRGGVLSLAFSPDDKLLASGGSDTSILVWDVAELTARHPLPEVRLSHADLEEQWNDLAAASGEVAYQALWQFAAGGKPAVAFLNDQLMLDPANERRVKHLIADLDADQFEVRERAMRDLTNFGVRAQPLLQRALKRTPSAEVRRRLEGLLEKLENPGPAHVELRQLRALQALEYAATPESRQVLQALTENEPDTPRGRAAKAAVKRLATQQP